MTKKADLLPLGSIVYLKEGTVKIVIVGRGTVIEDDQGEFYTDYLGFVYPSGFEPDDGIFFNKEDIDKVLFKGYVDDDEERFLEIYAEWESKLNIPKRKYGE